MERQDLPDGVAICERCGEIYTEELTLSEYCEICFFYADDDDFSMPNPNAADFDFGDWIGDVDTALELEEM